MLKFLAAYAAAALVFLMLNYNEKLFVNVGYGDDISIRDLALLIKEIVGYNGEIAFDTTKPNGTPKKLMDSSRLFSLGWKPAVSLREGIALAYRDFISKHNV